jgi:cytochrome c oxidase subunit II
MPDSPLFPTQASAMASRIDTLYVFLVAMSAFFTILIAALVIYFAIRYRRREANQTGQDVHGAMLLEVTWTVVPLLITMVIFFWSANLFFAMAKPPADTLNLYVVGKQWMWKVQHPGGQAEINEIHVPVGRDVKLTMTSQDVIHDVYIPAFRVKADVLPGKYTHLWFRPTKAGRYHLFCAEYCGLQHSGMIGWVTAMEPQQYEDWLAGGAGQVTLASAGEKLFQELACSSCHRSDSQGRGPVLDGVFGSQVALEDGRLVTADEAYIRESILNPQAKIVAGFKPLMPTFQGLVSEEGVLQLIEYIKSLKARGPDTRTSPAGAAGAPAPPKLPAPLPQQAGDRKK